VNTGSTPYWKLYATQSLDFHRVGVDLTERWISDGVFGHQYVVCQAGCPATTVNNPTINYDTMAGAFYVDLGVRYNVSDHLSAFLKIDNLMDRDPTPAPQTNTGLDTNPALYDIIGRTFRAGIRVSF
jgi:outer membrane receptor protein involved in Fe transport